MKNIIKKFLKQEHYNKGQIYKVCPSELLGEFTKFAELDKITEEELKTFLDKQRKEDFITKQFNK